MNAMLLFQSVAAGAVAGALAALAASFVTLILPSPYQVVLNAFTISIAAIGIGVVTGAIWGALATSAKRLTLYRVAMGAGFGAALVIAALTETFLDGAFVFMAAEAVAVFGVAGGLTPLLARQRLVVWMSPVVLLGALGTGTLLASAAGSNGPGLSLPTPVPTVVATPTAAGGVLRPSPTPTTGDAEGDLADTWTVAAGSIATFTVKEKLARLPLPNEAVVRGTALSGTLNRVGPSAVVLDLHQLTSDSSQRDRYMRNTMFRNAPTATFTLDQIPAMPEGFLTGLAAPGAVTGTLSIGGREVRLNLTGEARYDGEKIYLLGRASFTWDELALRPPNISGIVQVEDTVAVEVLVVATAA